LVGRPRCRPVPEARVPHRLQAPDVRGTPGDLELGARSNGRRPRSPGARGPPPLPAGKRSPVRAQVTWNDVGLLLVPPAFVTLILPEVAPGGTLVVIVPLSTTVNVAETPLNWTSVVP